MAVGITRHADPQITAGFQNFGNFIDDGLCCCGDIGRAGVKGDFANICDLHDLADAFFGRWDACNWVQFFDISHVNLKIRTASQFLNQQSGNFGAGAGVPGVSMYNKCVWPHDHGPIGQLRQCLDPRKHADRPAGGQPCDHACRLRYRALPKPRAGKVLDHHVGDVIWDSPTQLHSPFRAQRGGEFWYNGCCFFGRHRQFRCDGKGCGQGVFQCAHGIVKDTLVGPQGGDQRDVRIGDGHCAATDVIQRFDRHRDRIAPCA